MNLSVFLRSFIRAQIKVKFNLIELQSSLSFLLTLLGNPLRLHLVTVKEISAGTDCALSFSKVANNDVRMQELLKIQNETLHRI